MHLSFEEYAIFIGNKIRNIRKEYGFEKQGDLALKMSNIGKVSPTVVSRVETGKNTEFLKYLKIAEIFNLPISALLNYSSFEDIKENYRKTTKKLDIYKNFSLIEIANNELKNMGEYVNNSRIKQNKVLIDFEKGIGVGLDSSNVSKYIKGVENIRLKTLYLLFKEINDSIANYYSKV